MFLHYLPEHALAMVWPILNVVTINYVSATQLS
jgi:hypothetical protein